MPVRRIDNQHGEVNPNRPSDSVVVHYQSFIPKEMPQGPSGKLQNSISSARGDRHETKLHFAHRTGITGTLNDGHHPRGPEADAELLATATALRGAEKSSSVAGIGKLKAGGTLTTSRASYHMGLSEGTAGDDRAYLRGAACRPIQQHPLPYGRECDFVIGDKISVYRGDYCTSPSMQRTIGAGHAPGSPRLVSVHSPSALLQKVQQARSSVGSSPRRGGNGDAAASPLSSSARRLQSEPPAADGCNLYMGSQLAGSEKAERAVDAQARREIELLKTSAGRIEGSARAQREASEAMLTPRTLRLAAMQQEHTATFGASHSGRFGASASGYGIPQPPTPRSGEAADPTAALSANNYNSSGAYGRSRSPRLQPIINRAVLDREVPSPPSPRATDGVKARPVIGLTSTIPTDVSPY